MRVVIAEDLALLRDGLTRTAPGARLRGGRGRRQRPGPAAGAARRTGRTWPSSTSACRRRSPTRACRPRSRPAEIAGLPVLVLSQHVEPLYARELLADGQGGVGYLLKDRVSNVAQFVDAVRRVAAGGTVDGPRGHRAAAGPQRRPRHRRQLTAREREVLGLMAEGRSNAAIAGRAVHQREGRQPSTSPTSSPSSDLPPSDDDNRRVLAVLAYLKR